MKHNKHITLFILAIILLVTHITAQTLSPDDPLPFDPTVTHGQLENGLTYYIKQNQEPKDIAYLYLVVKVGSVDEDDNQRGLAHFLEHSAFNGSENFPGNALNEYLNSVGSGMMSGGSNAFTGFDNTVYYLQTRTTDPEQLDKFVMILSDYASRLSLDHDAIDRERSIILEEKRLRSGADSRMWDKVYETLFWDSKYSQRLPIGTPEVIAGFPYQTLKDFYHDWYRPDLQAVIAVGDFDTQAIEALIHKHFDAIPKKENPRPKIDFPVPLHTDTKFVLATDKEADQIGVLIYYKSPFQPIKTVADYYQETVISLLNTLLNKRFDDISRSPNPPFSQGFAVTRQMVNPLNTFTLAARVDEEHIMSAYTALITEIQRVKQHGFYPSELATAKADLLSQYEKQLLEKDKTNSRNLIWSLREHFTNGSPVMSIETEFALVNTMLGWIDIDDINEVIDLLITDENRVVILTGPDTITFPSFGGVAAEQTGWSSLFEQEILRIFEDAASAKLDPYPETVINEPLLAKLPKKVKEKAPKYDKTFDLYTWTLKNGAKVHLKTTDFKNNEINIHAFRLGGLSHADDHVYKSAKFAAAIQNASGIGAFDVTQLTTYLAGKDLRLASYLRNEAEGVDGRSSIKDFETMLQMMWITFTQPRFDESAFQTWQNRLCTELANQTNDPNAVFNNTWMDIVYDHHLRGVLETLEMVQAVDHKVAYDYFKSRFAGANGFEFLFVGNITHTELQPFIETYIASLPKGKAKINVIDRNVRMTERQHREVIHKGQETSRAVMQFIASQKVNWSLNQRMSFMISVLNNMLLDNVREKMSGVYAIYAVPQLVPAPANQLATTVMFGSDPARVDEIIAEVGRQINLLQDNEFDDSYFETAKEARKKEMEIQLRNNAYWVTGIREMWVYGYTPEEICDPIGFMEGITRDDISSMARLCFDVEKGVTVVLLPEGDDKTE